MKRHPWASVSPGSSWTCGIGSMSSSQIASASQGSASAGIGRASQSTAASAAKSVRSSIGRFSLCGDGAAAGPRLLGEGRVTRRLRAAARRQAAAHAIPRRTQYSRRKPDPASASSGQSPVR